MILVTFYTCIQKSKKLLRYYFFYIIIIFVETYLELYKYEGYAFYNEDCIQVCRYSTMYTLFKEENYVIRR